MTRRQLIFAMVTSFLKPVAALPVRNPIEHDQAIFLAVLYKDEIRFYEQFSEGDRTLMSEVAVWLEYPQGFGEKETSQFLLRIQKHSSEFPIGRQRMLDVYHELTVPSVRQFHDQVFNRMLWNSFFWINLSKEIEGRNEAIWQELAESAKKQFADYITPTQLLAESVYQLRELFALQLEVEPPKLSKAVIRTHGQHLKTHKGLLLLASAEYIRLMQHEAPSEIESLHLVSTSVEQIAKLVAIVRSEDERTVCASGLDVLFRMEELRVQHWKKIVSDNADSPGIAASAKTAVHSHEQFAGVYGWARSLLSQKRFISTPASLKKKTALVLLDTAKIAMENALTLQGFLDKNRPELSLKP